VLILLFVQGYGTVSECVDSCTPFVYGTSFKLASLILALRLFAPNSIAVSRPLFIEEHGLRLLLSKEGVGVELSRQSYEAGDWATAVEEAWMQGKHLKSRKRTEAAGGIGSGIREMKGREMAKTVVNWASDCGTGMRR
jgi:hypothetical protein